MHSDTTDSSLVRAKRGPSISGHDSISLSKKASIFNFRLDNFSKLDVMKADGMIENVTKPKYLPPIPVEVALLVKFCVEHLIKHKLHKNKLFQLQGKGSEQRKLIQSIKNGDLPTKLSGYSSRSISFVIRELLENHYAPLFPYEEFAWMEEQVEAISKDKFIENTIQCMHTKLIPERYVLLESLLLLLYKLHLKQDHTVDDPDWISTRDVIGSILARPAEDELAETQTIRRTIGHLLLENVPVLLKQKRKSHTSPYEPSTFSSMAQNGSFYSKQKAKQEVDDDTRAGKNNVKRRPQLSSSKASTLLKLMRVIVDSPHQKTGLFVQKTLREEEEMFSLKKLLSSRKDVALLPLDCYSIHTIGQYILQTLCYESEPLLGYHANEILLHARDYRVALANVFKSISDVHQRLSMLLFQCIDQSLSSLSHKSYIEELSCLKEILFPCFFSSIKEKEEEKDNDDSGDDKKEVNEIKEQLMNDLFKYGKEILMQVINQEQGVELYTRSAIKRSISNNINSGENMRSSIPKQSEQEEEEEEEEEEETTQLKVQQELQVSTFFSVAVIVVWAIKCYKKAARRTIMMPTLRRINSISLSSIVHDHLTSKSRQSVTSNTCSTNSDSINFHNNNSSSFMDPIITSTIKTKLSMIPSFSDQANQAKNIGSSTYHRRRVMDGFSSNVLCEMIEFLLCSKPDPSLYFEKTNRCRPKEQELLMNHFKRGGKKSGYQFCSLFSIANVIKKMLSQKFEAIVPLEMVHLYMNHHHLNTRQHSGIEEGNRHPLNSTASDSDTTCTWIKNIRSHEPKMETITIHLWKLEAFLLKILPLHKRRLLQLLLSHLDHITNHKDTDDTMIQQVYQEMLPLLFAPVFSSEKQSEIDDYPYNNIQIQIHGDVVVSNIFQHQDRKTITKKIQTPKNPNTCTTSSRMQPVNTKVYDQHTTCSKKSKETNPLTLTQAAELVSHEFLLKPTKAPLTLPRLENVNLCEHPMNLTDWAHASHLIHKTMQNCIVPASTFYQWVQDMKQDESESFSQQEFIRDHLLQLCTSKEFQQYSQYYAMKELYDFLYDIFLAYSTSFTTSSTTTTDVMTVRDLQTFCNDCFLLNEYHDWMLQMDSKQHLSKKVIHFDRFVLFVLSSQYSEAERFILHHVYPFSQRKSQAPKKTLTTSLQFEPCLFEMAQLHGAKIYEVCSWILSDQVSNSDFQTSNGNQSLLLQSFDSIHAKDVAIQHIAAHLRLVPYLLSASKVKEISYQVLSLGDNKNLTLIKVLEVFYHLTREILSHEQVAYLYPTMEKKLQVLFHVWGLADPSVTK